VQTAGSVSSIVRYPQRLLFALTRLIPDLTILTGAGLPEAEEQLRACGVNEYVGKEFSLHHLGGALKRALAASQSATLASASANTATIKGT